MCLQTAALKNYLHVWLTCMDTDKHTQTHAHTILPPGRSWLRSVCSNIAMGIPTFLERPATSTFFPTVSIPAQTYLSKENVFEQFSLIALLKGELEKQNCFDCLINNAEHWKHECHTEPEAVFHLWLIPGMWEKLLCQQYHRLAPQCHANDNYWIYFQPTHKLLRWFIVWGEACISHVSLCISLIAYMDVVQLCCHFGKQSVKPAVKFDIYVDFI